MDAETKKEAENPNRKKKTDPPILLCLFDGKVFESTMFRSTPTELTAVGTFAIRENIEKNPSESRDLLSG